MAAGGRMTWAKIDDQFHSHRKAARAWKCPRALGLHLLAISYCAGHLTDGLVHSEFVEEKIPAVRERDTVTGALCDAGLWTPQAEGFQINDWLEYNPSRADVIARRTADADRKRSARDARSARSPAGHAPESARTPDGVRDMSVLPGPARPDPTLITTPPLPPASGGNQIPERPPGKRQTDLAAYEQAVAVFAAEHFPDVHAEWVRGAIANLRDARTADDLRPYIERWAQGVPA